MRQNVQFMATDVSAIYESTKLLAEYLLFHYGSADEILPPGTDWPVGMGEALDFAVRTPRHFDSRTVARGLDLGCAVGRSTCEMSKSCGEVLGIDFSDSFINAANALKAGHGVAYERREEAALTMPLVARLPAATETARLSFEQGDAMNLRADLGEFDRVHAANLMCRLREPMRLLERLPDLVKRGGELVIATPCTWLEEFTPPSNWPTRGTFEWLLEVLGADFELQRQLNEPFLIRETARKFQWTHSLVTVWHRHG